jgi:hypothetical protein
MDGVMNSKYLKEPTEEQKIYDEVIGKIEERNKNE